MTLLRLLFAKPGLSRSALAAEAQLTKSTVSLLVNELMAEGWLQEHEVIASGELGRRPTPLFVDPHRLLLLGAELGIEGVEVVITSLTGKVVASLVASYGPDTQAATCIQLLARSLLKVLEQVDLGRQKIIGIGIGLPGGVNEDSECLIFAPNLGWRDVAFGAALRGELCASVLAGTPLFLQNEADVAALGESEFNPSEKADPLLYVSISHGVGAGVLVGDRLLTGYRGFAGEVGHIILQWEGPLCTCGRKGCAEALIGFRAMLGGNKPDPQRPEATNQLAEIQRRIREADPITMQSVDQAGRYLGVLLQNLTAAYDPARIVLGGAATNLGAVYLAPALATLYGYAKSAGLPQPSVKVSSFGSSAVAVGGAGMVRYRLTRPLLGKVREI